MSARDDASRARRLFVVDAACTACGMGLLGLGLAVLIDHENCLNHLGLRCDICHRVCPVIDQQRNERTGGHAMFIPVVHADACTGCGKCEKACPLPVAAIKVFPVELARGEPGAHYRLGWVEKGKAGGSLVAPDAAHQYNRPSGLRYENGRVVPMDPAASGAAAAPASSVLPRALQQDRL